MFTFFAAEKSKGTKIWEKSKIPWADLENYRQDSIFVSVMEEKSYELSNHLGNVHITLSDYRRKEEDGLGVAYFSQVKSASDYYPFGQLLTEGNYSAGDYRFGFQGQEMDNEIKGTGNSINFKYRMHDARIGRFFAVDPLVSDAPGWSPYNFCWNNPILNVDPDGRWADGYQDLQGNYKWHDDETEDVIYKDDKFWLKVTDDRAIFNMAAAGILDNVPEPSDPGQITEADNLTSFEMWLDSPSESVGEGIGKTGANIGYSLVNSPYSLLTGQTIGGTHLNSSEKMDAFVDVAPALISFGLTKTGSVIKTTEKGLQGYNQFLKGAKKSGIEFKGLNWQKNAGNAFQINKVNQQGLKDLDKARNILNVGNTTKKEVEK